MFQSYISPSRRFFILNDRPGSADSNKILIQSAYSINRTLFYLFNRLITFHKSERYLKSAVKWFPQRGFITGAPASRDYRDANEDEFNIISAGF